jgi:hypothetical protein
MLYKYQYYLTAKEKINESRVGRIHQVYEILVSRLSVGTLNTEEATCCPLVV